jgi:hypothetical protein
MLITQEEDEAKQGRQGNRANPNSKLTNTKRKSGFIVPTKDNSDEKQNKKQKTEKVCIILYIYTK